ncbi:ribosomal-protein-alanine N-acetyltransferase [Thiocapsa imhoffii]|uniref:[Ribosomal protein bS18]-alanine N-acetyltransferase n=1 Tax=Thiocapsa imhoffii TaxID=382777 RepID=A0A9X1B992_9GAMM|nr:ribosomal protein S18-alanine N-acetyltransferase [Thiocapsa imhoffii]MBK1644825.1 ribosomal-protein-alanine N-acetyltransferase [Thiocapsa imhoffii]
MREGDVTRVCAMDRESYDFPWTEGIFRDCLRVGYSCWIGEIETTPVAHAIMAVAVGECHILNLCVYPDWQGRGFGRRLLRHLLTFARTRKADSAFLEVRISNARARALYASEGFCEVGVRPGYYPARKGREDAVVLARALDPGTTERLAG